MDVHEMYCCLQGEGALVGLPSVLVRLQGCPFRCRWCDSRYAWRYGDGVGLTPERVVEQVERWRCEFVIITGGEPMADADLSLRPGLAELTHLLRAAGKHVTIETSGVLFAPDLACDLMSISPKLRNAWPTETKGHRHPPELDMEVLGSLVHVYPYQIKFVVDGPDDLREVHRIVEALAAVKRDRVMLMPQARTREEFLERAPWVADACKQTGYRFGHRLHILLWSSQRGR
jgi:7-carboxy-7-deazaguanine synthase